MHHILRLTVFNAFSLFLLPNLLAGVIVHGGIITYLLGGFFLSVISIFVKPLLKIITLPLNLVTFGAVTYLINAVVLYLMTVLVPQISVHAFIFKKVTWAGFVIPTMHINTFFAYVLAALALSLIDVFLSWATEK